jgi:hypothetical protein
MLSGIIGGELEGKVKKDFGWNMEITLQSNRSTGFKPLSKRCVVKRITGHRLQIDGFYK